VKIAVIIKIAPDCGSMPTFCAGITGYNKILVMRAKKIFTCAGKAAELKYGAVRNRLLTLTKIRNEASI
jgi:predicted transcriptional regulator of viral defense system